MAGQLQAFLVLLLLVPACSAVFCCSMWVSTDVGTKVWLQSANTGYSVQVTATSSTGITVLLPASDDYVLTCGTSASGPWILSASNISCPQGHLGVGYCENRCTGSCPGLSGSAPPSPFPSPSAFICTSPSPSSSPSPSPSPSRSASPSPSVSPSPSASPSPSPSPSGGGGCFIGTVPVTLADGSVKLAQDVEVGDIVATPAGPSEVLFVSTETVNTLIFSVNEITDPWVTPEHPFPKYGVPSYDPNQAGWYSFITNQTGTSWPWLDAVQPIVGGSSLLKYDVTTNTTSESNVTQVHGPKSFAGQVYTYQAWPLNSPTRVPNSYMVGHGYVAYSYLQPYIAAAGMIYSALLVIDLVTPLVTNPSAWAPPGTNVSQNCWGAGLAEIHAPVLYAAIETAFTTFAPPGTPIPTSPPAGYDGPASEFIEFLREFAITLGRRRKRFDQIQPFYFEGLPRPSVNTPKGVFSQLRFIDFVPYQNKLAVLYEGRAAWLDWIPAPLANVTILAGLGAFAEFAYSYDYTTLASLCTY